MLGPHRVAPQVERVRLLDLPGGHERRHLGAGLGLGLGLGLGSGLATSADFLPTLSAAELEAVHPDPCIEP